MVKPWYIKGVHKVKKTKQKQKQKKKKKIAKQKKTSTKHYKVVVLESLANSQENTCVRVTF